MIKKLFGNKIVGFIFSILEWIVFLILLLLVILTGIQRFSNQGNFFGYRIYTVASNSMIPIYSIGDTLLIEDVPPTEIQVGDAVTYMGEASGLKGMIITHQVQKIEVIDGKIQFHTKGVANEIEDPIVSEEQVFGKVIHKFVFLSILGKVTSNMTTMIIFLTIPIAILIAVEFMKIIYHKEDDEDDENDDENEDNDDKKTSIDIVDVDVSEENNANIENNELKNDEITHMENVDGCESNDGNFQFDGDDYIEKSNELIEIALNINQLENEENEITNDEKNNKNDII